MTRVHVADLVTAEIRGISPYEPGKPLDELERELGDALPPGGVIKLASNENPLGPSPRAVEAGRRALASAQLYPDGGAYHLKQRIAAEHGVSVAEIAVGNGSNELIDLLVRTFCPPGYEVLAPARSFACFKLATVAHGGVYREVERGDDFAYRLDRIAAEASERTRLVFLANPDNPTGVYASREALGRLARDLPPHVVLVVDEAYLEYARAEDFPDTLRLRGERQLIVALRTFSKIHGLAGLRCGYAIAPAEVVQFLDRVRNPFNVNSVAQAAAEAALDDHEHMAAARAVNLAGMAQLHEGLARLGLGWTPSQANFLLVDVSPRDGRALFQALLGRGVIVRPMSGYALPRHVRVTVGTAEQNARLLAALAAVLLEPLAEAPVEAEGRSAK